MTEGILLRSMILNCTILIVSALFEIDFLHQYRDTKDSYWLFASLVMGVLAVVLVFRTSKLAVQRVP